MKLTDCLLTTVSNCHEDRIHLCGLRMDLCKKKMFLTFRN